MGTFLFWGVWLIAFTFFSITTRAQRRGWRINFWGFTGCSVLATGVANLLQQGYLTVA